ncbi:hypothetical protein FH609_027050 [Streptomyces sp. 3MP-14]|uniref:Sortase n=1 Tax=Streptomyces mimosae TaxID=2586635 RepID=A0A5N5ZY35_9ACTN|nr:MULTISPECIES: hypothetical protein [Streptomyces]KAB8161407.1 hypothetical protein FH607_025345 [Streptomyces mimosae]KAB8173269.1 hypothetical protein FH609_027050 [Streptomyces sp. 3MP-14]
MGITRSLTLTLCAAATVTATVSTAPAGAADGQPTEGDAVLVTPVAPLPGEDVGLLVPGCAGADSGEAVSLAFSTTVRLTPGSPGGGLVGEARIESTAAPGDHPIQVTCGHPEGALFGLVTVGGGEAGALADGAGGGSDPAAGSPASDGEDSTLAPDAPRPFGEHGGDRGRERGDGHEAAGQRGERCGPGHEKPEHERPGHERPGHERPGHTDGPEKPEWPDKPEHQRGGGGGQGHGTDDRCRHEGGGREHGTSSPTAPVRAGGGGTASLASTPAQPPVSWGDAVPAGLALLAGGGATWAVRRLRSRSRTDR